jgi:hypothetical protein
MREENTRARYSRMQQDNQNTAIYSNIEIQPSTARYSPVQQDSATQNKTQQEGYSWKGQSITRSNKIHQNSAR